MRSLVASQSRSLTDALRFRYGCRRALNFPIYGPRIFPSSVVSPALPGAQQQTSAGCTRAPRQRIRTRAKAHHLVRAVQPSIRFAAFIFAQAERQHNLFLYPPLDALALDHLLTRATASSRQLARLGLADAANISRAESRYAPTSASSPELSNISRCGLWRLCAEN